MSSSSSSTPLLQNGERISTLSSRYMTRMQALAVNIEKIMLAGGVKKVTRVIGKQDEPNHIFDMLISDFGQPEKSMSLLECELAARATAACEEEKALRFSISCYTTENAQPTKPIVSTRIALRIQFASNEAMERCQEASRPFWPDWKRYMIPVPKPKAEVIATESVKATLDECTSAVL